MFIMIHIQSVSIILVSCHSPAPSENVCSGQRHTEGGVVDTSTTVITVEFQGISHVKVQDYCPPTWNNSVNMLLGIYIYEFITYTTTGYS